MNAATLPETDERSLVALLQDGDPRAFDMLYKQHAAHVLRAAQRVGLDRRAAEDVTQEIFVHIWRHPDRVDLERGQIRTLLMAMARYRAIDFVRAESARRRREQLVSDQPHTTFNWVTADVSETVIHADTRARQCRELRTAVALLPDQQRTSVELAYLRGHTFREVALITNVPQGTAKSRLRLALARLEQQLPTVQLAITADVAMAGIDATGTATDDRQAS